MKEDERLKLKDRFVRVTDRDGNEFVCRASALKDPKQLSEEEKKACIGASAPRGLVSSPF